MPKQPLEGGKNMYNGRLVEWGSPCNGDIVYILGGETIISNNGGVYEVSIKGLIRGRYSTLDKALDSVRY